MTSPKRRPPARKPAETEIPVPTQAHGGRCESWLAEHFPALSPAALAQLFAGKRIKLNGHPARPETLLNPGDILAVPADVAKREAKRAGPIPLDILYENASCAVIRKPAGLVMEPGPGHRHGTLRDALLAHYGEPQRRIGPAKDYGLVHRLDRDTSGVLLVARNAEAYDSLVRQFAEHRIQKVYVALAAGNLPVGARLTLKTPLRKIREGGKSRVRAAGKRGGAQAETLIRPLESFLNGRYTLVEAQPRTGRTHQIRVHLAEAGTPIVGDADYGDPMANAQAARQWGIRRIFLHAETIRFTDPQTHHVIEVEDQLPRDLADVIHRLEEAHPA